MALVAEFTTARETFAIGRALVRRASQTIELERIIPTGESLVPCYWVWGDGLATYEDELATEPDIEDVEAIARTDEGTLYQVTWRGEPSSCVHDLFDLDFTLLSGICTADGWAFEVRFPSTDAARRFQRYLTDREIPHTLERVCQIADRVPEASGELTDQQREALLVAYRIGYFEEPRETDLGELADRLGISPSAASGRLRRGYAALIEDRFEPGAGDSPGRSATVHKSPK